VFILEFRQLEYFLTVSKLNSFTAAANKLFVTQPTITNAIRSLEDELGIKLFDRSQKRIVLTAEGEVFLTHVQHVMTNISTALAEMNDLKVLGRGFVRVVVSPLLMPNFFPSIYACFKQEFPSLEIQIREESFRTAQKLLDNDEVDFAFIPALRQTNFIDAIKLCTVDFKVYVNRRHPRAHDEMFLVQHLQDESLALCDKDSFVQDIIGEECDKNGFKPKLIYSSNHLSSLFGLVAANLAITVLPDQQYHLPDEVVGLPLEPVIQVDFCLSNKKDRYASIAAQTFLNFIRQTIKAR
jgi:DNA-binding transcriptional LysR family regulator